MATDATIAGFVIKFVWAFLPPADAVIVVDPTLKVVTAPVSETVATELSELDQPTIQSASGFPAESTAEAVNLNAPPTATLADGDGDTTTAPTGTRVTDKYAIAVFPLIVSEMDVTPGPTA